MAKALTSLTCRVTKAGANRREIPDGGCRGLYLIIQPSGAKSWATRFRFRGAPRKLTLGPFLADGQQGADAEPKLGAPLTLAAARELCTRAKREAKGGVDPTAVRRKQRIAQRAVERDTLQAVAEEYLRREGEKLRSLAQRRADLELLYRPLGRQPITEIRRSHYRRVLDGISDTRGPVRADRVLAALSRLLNWHASRDDDFVNPLARGMRYTRPNELARSRVLSDDELRKLWLTAETYPGPFGAYLQFTLLTATRRSEAAGLRRSELSDDGGTWIIPGSRYKSGKDVVIPLSRAAQRIIAAQPQLGDFIFTSTGGRPLGGFTHRKADFDKACAVSGWRLHDLRRTARTLLSRAGVSADVAERCLGHALVGVRSVYDRHEFETEKRHAFEALAAQIGHIVRPPKATITDMAEARRRRRR